MSATWQPRATHKPTVEPTVQGMRAPIAGKKERRFDNELPANGCDPAVEVPDL